MVDTVRTETDLLTNLFQDNQANHSITAQDMRDLIISMQHKDSHGMFDYNDLATATTPISLTANTETKLTNDALGAQTLRTFAPTDVTDVWNTTTNQFDFSELTPGTMVNMRITLEVNILSNNTDVNVDMYFAIGGFPYTISFNQESYKTTGMKEISRFIGFYIADDNTRLNPAELRITTDSNATVKVNGWYLSILQR